MLSCAAGGGARGVIAESAEPVVMVRAHLLDAALPSRINPPWCDQIRNADFIKLAVEKLGPKWHTVHCLRPAIMRRPRRESTG